MSNKTTKQTKQTWNIVVFALWTLGLLALIFYPVHAPLFWAWPAGIAAGDALSELVGAYYERKKG